MTERWNGLEKLLELTGLDESPVGMFYSAEPPTEGLTPSKGQLLSVDKEARGEIDWGGLWGNFSCVISHIWRARRMNKPVWFAEDQYGCPGGGFYLGYFKPQLEFIAHYVSTGIPGYVEGEFYLPSPQACRDFFNFVDPRPAPQPYAVFKPLNLFATDEEPELISFFCRPESMSGLYTLVAFTTGRWDAVVTPFAAGCTSLVSWPLYFLAQGQDVAVLGGWDVSARKFFKTDELSLTVSRSMFERMLAKFPESFLKTKTWEGAWKKIERSRKAWGEVEVAKQT